MERDHDHNKVTHAEMNAAYDIGAAVPLAQSISWLTRYQDSWWVVYEGGWLRITDELTAADIDDRAARLAAEQDIVLANAAGHPAGAAELQEEPCRQPRS